MSVLADDFEQRELCTAAECRELTRRIESLRALWTSHHDHVPVHSLGISGFLVPSDATYRRIAAECNPVLLRAFADLYERMRTFLAARVGQPVLDHPYGALPGFNLFGDHEYFATPFASAHFDVQYRNLEWPDHVDVRDVCSFTLPLALPRAGGGLDVWDLREHDLAALDDEARIELVDTTARETLEHRVGCAVVHRGDVLHRIAPARRIAAGDRRYTLQGHVARSGPNYYWYW
jgi:hypothetical protein